MTIHYPIVFEREDHGAVSAYVAGLPVYAQAATQARAERAILGTLAAYLEANPDDRSLAAVKVAAVTRYVRRPPSLSMRSPAALVGSQRSKRKAASSRVNGRLGGRPAARR